MAERFVTWWPVEARLIHIVDKEAADPWRGICSSWRYWPDDSPYEVPPGDEYMVCVTCTKIKERREKRRKRS